MSSPTPCFVFAPFTPERAPAPRVPPSVKAQREAMLRDLRRLRNQHQDEHADCNACRTLNMDTAVPPGAPRPLRRCSRRQLQTAMMSVYLTGSPTPASHAPLNQD